MCVSALWVNYPILVKQINFLDTTVKIDHEQNLYTDLYTKPTDTNSYLNYNSAHPPNCKNSLPYSQLLRIRRICTREEDFLRNAKKKINEFKSKDYPSEILNEALEKTKNLTRKELIKKKTKAENLEKKNETYLTCTFRPNYQKVPKIVKKNLNILARSATTKELHRSQLKIGYKHPKNLREMLVRAKTDYHPGENSSTDKNKKKCKEARNKCNKKNCKYCVKINISGKISNGDQKYECKKDVTCNSSNVIYCLECKICNMKYIGQTKRKIKDRVREHFYFINQKKGSDVAYHFNQKDHHGIHDIEIHIVDFIYKHPESKRAGMLRNTLEFNWIQRLQTVMDNK